MDAWKGGWNTDQMDSMDKRTDKMIHGLTDGLIRGLINTQMMVVGCKIMRFLSRHNYNYTLHT